MAGTNTARIGDLDRLLETERRLLQRLREARAEADSLVAQAEAAASQREAALATELETEQRLADERLLQEQHDRERDIAEGTQRQIAAYQRISAVRLTELARKLAHRLLEEDGAP